MAKSQLVDRFLKYVTFDTQSRCNTGKVPSTEGQKKLGDYLAQELQEMGLADAVCDAHAYVTATLPANTDRSIPTFALIAHMDTAEEVSGRNVKPRIVLYEGGDIILDPAADIRIAEKDFPDLARFRGQELIVTDGSTLLGADDKAGVASIVETVRWFLDHPEEEHGTVKIVFTPDEEIGHGAVLLDLDALGAEFAYTIDAGDVGEFCWETFSGAKATVNITGRSIHPGKAKDKMKNASLMLLDFISRLPADERPETTEEREGFFHVLQICGDVESATGVFLVRDHDRKTFEARKERLRAIAGAVDETYGYHCCELTIEDQYYNMGDFLADKMHIVEYAREAMRRLGVEPVEMALRGGTDGSVLSGRGLPTPNIFKGGMNGHGRQEYLPIPSFEKSYEVVKELVRVVAEGR